MLGVYVAGKSGAHLNPAVTLANCVYRQFPWRKFPKYLVAQTLGAMVASAVVYANYKSAIDVFEGGSDIRTVPGYSNHSTAGIFCTYPAAFLTRTGMFFSEFIASSILMFCIYAINDEKNNGAGNLGPLALFFLIFGIGACFGWETGYAINLARDFGPRLMSYMLGYGPEVWRAGGYYFWVSLVTEHKCGSRLPDVPDTNGCSILWYHVRWIPLRCLHLYGAEPNQYTLDGPQKDREAKQVAMVEYRSVMQLLRSLRL
jgi:aquaglyceroporin related protein